jgi:hypothetical protein
VPAQKIAPGSAASSEDRRHLRPGASGTLRPGASGTLRPGASGTLRPGASGTLR